MQVLLFDYRNSEKSFFENNKFADFNITFFEESLNNKTKLTKEQFYETDVLCVYRSSILTEDVLKKFSNLRIIATRSYAFSHIDLRYCMEHNIAVVNVGQYGEDAVAQYALGLIIALERKIKMAIKDINNHTVNPVKYEGKLLNRLTVGIVGCGKVGIKLAEILHLFGIEVLVSSYKESLNFENFCNIVPFDELLNKSDVISLHMPYTIENYRIIGEEEFNKMKNNVIIINTSSIELIDLEALYKNILSGKVKAAGLDILDSDYTKGKAENLGNETMNVEENSKITEKLLEMPNVIITPHIAYNTLDTIDYVLETTFNNIRDFYKGMHTNRVC